MSAIEITKSVLVAQLNNTANTFALGLASVTLLACQEVRPIIRVSTANLENYQLDLSQLIPLLEHPQEGPVALLELTKTHLRTLISDSYRLIWTYASGTNQLTILQNAPWFSFARLIRNALSHNVRFIFTPNDKLMLPVTWHRCTVTPDMDGHDLLLEFFTPADAWRLFAEMREYATDALA